MKVSKLRDELKMLGLLLRRKMPIQCHGYINPQFIVSFLWAQQKKLTPLYEIRAWWNSHQDINGRRYLLRQKLLLILIIPFLRSEFTLQLSWQTWGYWETIIPKASLYSMITKPLAEPFLMHISKMDVISTRITDISTWQII